MPKAKTDNKFAIPEIEEMFKAGVHFGHKKQRSTPSSKSYVFTSKNDIFVINLEKTRDCLETALKFMNESVKEGKTILLVGTKRQARELIEEMGKGLNLPYISYRWFGGFLTNFETMQKRMKGMEKLTDDINNKKDNFTKKELLEKTRELEKLEKAFGGVKELKKLPDIIFVLDTAHEKNAVAEAIKTGVIIVGICDTNANPSLIDYPVPANDDAKKSISLILDLFKKALAVKAS